MAYLLENNCIGTAAHVKLFEDKHGRGTKVLEMWINGELVYSARKPPTSNSRLLVSRNKREGKVHVMLRGL